LRARVIASPLDIAIIVAAFGGFIYIGKRAGSASTTQDEFFTAGRTLTWFPIGLSIIATWTSAAAFVSAPGWVYQDGLRAFIIVLNIPLVMWICSGIFVPFAYNLRIASVYQYVELRFGDAARLLVAGGFLVTSTMLIGVMVLVPTMVLQAVTGLSSVMITSIILLVAVAYTIMGGIRAVIWTDVLQMAILWFGGAVVFGLVLYGIDGDLAEGLQQSAAAGKLESLDFSWDMAVNNGVWVSLIGYGILHLQYFSSDQSQVQRLFTARSMKDVKQAFWFSGIVLNTQFFLFMTLGLLLFVFYRGREFDDANMVMVDYIVNYVPPGIFGIIVAAIFAASMASIAPLLNSMTTVYIKDFHERWVLRTSGGTASVATSRLVTLVFGLGTALFVKLMGEGPKSPLVALMGEYASYLTGAMLGVFVMGMFSRRTNETGVCVGFVAGVAVVAIMDGRFDFDWGWKSPIGLVTTCGVAYLVSALTGWENRDVDAYTYSGQRRQMIAEGRIEQDGVYILPGRFERRSYVLLAFFLMQFLVLCMIASLG
jgi:SSS family solute:Na+ symporter